MHKIITQITLFRFGLKRFQDDVNYHLDNGWKLSELTIERQWFRFLCYAILEKSDNDPVVVEE